ncbi:MAG TPA: hypothetical protein VF316_06340 [Polyangiaceae bacterium]
MPLLGAQVPASSKLAGTGEVNAGKVCITYRLEKAEGWWSLLRAVGDADPRPVLRSGSRVTPARYRTLTEILRVYEGQRRADVRAGTRLGVAVEPRLERYP